MEQSLNSILLRYWGYPSFRPLQEDIIRSVLQGKDTLALLPTGGGKSLCYQVPGILLHGVCLVVTPLIALMKDQVQSLRNKGIGAVAIFHGMSRSEIDIALDNCIYGDTRFLYLSPERLTTEIVRSRLEKMKVKLVAVDEAHCISQWGYDFRPPYLRIAEIRELLPGIPILALTATATSKVVTDIMEKLAFGGRHIFRKSFERKNLAYLVFKEEDKAGRLLRIARNVKGPGIVYVRNRRKTQEVASFLQRHQINAESYHAGLDPSERDRRQNAWMKERTRIIVATNAFGMGIDKPNVRFVVHLDVPESPEAYFQEAGRAGRDGQKSYAVLLYQPSDIADLEKNHELAFPPLEEIKKIYDSLGNFFQLATGAGRDTSYSFDLSAFASGFGFDPNKTMHALRFLEREGYIGLSEALTHPSRIFVHAGREELYRYQVANPRFDPFIRLLLRTYTGLLSGFVKINEADIARKGNMDRTQVTEILKHLRTQGIIQYEIQNQEPLITYLENRLPVSHLSISGENLQHRKSFALSRLKSMTEYTTGKGFCRSMFLLLYFGEKPTGRCGQCDFCLERKKVDLPDQAFDDLLLWIRQALSSGKRAEDLMEALPLDPDEEKQKRVIRWLTDNEYIIQTEDGILFWNEKNKPPRNA